MTSSVSGFRVLALLASLAVIITACSSQPAQTRQGREGSAAPQGDEHRFVVLDPGHFHAALVFKPSGYGGVSEQVGIYAPVDEDFTDHMARVVPFNTRQDDPASWRYRISLGPDFQDAMLRERFGDIAVLSGRNQPKIDRILGCVEGGFNVLADKPWVIEKAKLPVLEKVIAAAKANGRIAYDIMTERHEITTILQREIVGDEATFGTITQGTPNDPAVVKESVHHLYKMVAGRPNKRPWWFFDTAVQGEGLVDVTTHLVDIIFWVLFPGQSIDAAGDIEMGSAKHWSTELNQAQFTKVTRKESFPPQLELNSDGNLDYFCNGRMNFAVKGVNCAVQVIWNFQAPEGTGDTHYSVIKGSKAHVLVLQGEEQGYKPRLYVQAAPGASRAGVGEALKALIARLDSGKYPGVKAVEDGERWQVVIPEKYKDGHESHFGQVTESFLAYLDGRAELPEWEYANLYAKYFVTTSAVEMARRAE